MKKIYLFRALFAQIQAKITFLQRLVSHYKLKNIFVLGCHFVDVKIMKFYLVRRKLINDSYKKCLTDQLKQ